MLQREPKAVMGWAPAVSFGCKVPVPEEKRAVPAHKVLAIRRSLALAHMVPGYARAVRMVVGRNFERRRGAAPVPDPSVGLLRLGYRTVLLHWRSVRLL